MSLSKRQKNTKRQSGVTLIELMLSLMIGMFLLLGVIGLFNTTKRSFGLQNGVSGISETARFAIDTITWHTRMAGFRDSEWSRGLVFNALSVQNGDDAPDSLTLSYETPVDCNQLPGTDDFITIQFQVTNESLVCNTRVLFEDVVDMQIFIGEDTDNDGIVNRFREQDGSVPSNRIKVLNINLLIGTDDTALSDTAPTLTNTFWSVTPADDGRLYQEYSFNVTIRNAI